MFVSLLNGQKQLKCDPFLLDDGQKWPGAHAVVQTVFDVLTNHKSGAIGQLTINDGVKCNVNLKPNVFLLPEFDGSEDN